MVAYNHDIVRTQNDDDSEFAQGIQAREMKRKIKVDLKESRRKIKHFIKYCQVPGNILEDAKYRYRGGMTSRDLLRVKSGNKYENAPHIGRILPAKRPVVITQEQSKRIASHQEQQRLQREEDHTLKVYTSTAKNESESASKDFSLIEIIRELNAPVLPKPDKDWFEDTVPLKTKPSKPVAHAKQTLESKYQHICEKMEVQELSLEGLSIDERLTVKHYLKIQSSNIVNSKFPGSLDKLSKIEKQCFSFMKSINTHNFSYKGIKSLQKSDENNGLFMDDIGANHSSNHEMQNLSSVSKQINFEPKEHTDKAYNGASDLQLQQWYFDQKYKIMASSGAPVKRKKYWGEPSDCASLMQIQRDNYKYRQFLNKQPTDQVFKIELVCAKPILSSKAKIEESKQSKNFPIKDLQEYEFFKQQKSYFYTNPNTTGNSEAQCKELNSIVRNVKFALGDIPAEEFYAQECLEDDLEHPKGSANKYQSAEYFKSQRREKQVWSGDFNENFDTHFERSKKETYDKVMKKIQIQEKQNQQSSTVNQTIAYASSKDVLEKASGGMLDHMMHNSHRDKSLSDLHSKEGDFGKDQHSLGDEDMLLEGPSTQTSTKSNHHHDGITAEEVLPRVTKSLANVLNHAKCIMKLTYTKFEWTEQELMNFHRPNIQIIFDSLKKDADQNRYRNIQISSTGKFVISLGQSQTPEDAKMNETIDTAFPKINIRVNTNEYIERRSKKIGINAHEYFKDRFKMSLKDGKFCIFEHIDQRPLFVNNFGMASKLKRYVYSDDVLPSAAFTKKPQNALLKHMGPYGVQVLKKKGEKIPLLGQIADTKQYKGITVLENNMYFCPTFYHKTQRNDFLCIMHQDKHGKNQVFVREMEEMYLMGQIEPKQHMEVYNPQSRSYQHFIKRRTQAYVVRFLQENDNRINFFELNKFFSYINDQILKKIIKEIHVEVDRNQTCSRAAEYNDEQFKTLIPPENICQYESAQFGEQMLRKVGIREITNADKISYATNKFCSEETEIKKQLIARIIEEEVLSTPWNLSQNFCHNRQQRGMMMLEGIGDPSNGHGGYSYLKLPLKISQDSLNKAKINRMYLNPAIQNPKAVTGTDADLRKLSKKIIQQKLIDLGYRKEHIDQYTRWRMVALLRDRSSQAVTQGIEGEMKKFARGVRFTSKKQREMYQKQVNDIFKKQINNLHRETADFIQDLSDSESSDVKQKKINEMQQINTNNSKSLIELKEDIEVKKLQDIPGYEILLMNSITQGALGPAQSGQSGMLGNIGGTFSGFDDKEAIKRALKDRISQGQTLDCQILRKKIKPVNGDRDKIERVIFCSDARQIKGFLKRKHKHEVKIVRKKKTSFKEKMKTSKLISEGGDYKERRSESSSFRQQPSRSKDVNYSQPISSKQPDGASVKIQIGGAIIPPIDSRRQVSVEPQPSKYSVSLGSKPDAIRLTGFDRPAPQKIQISMVTSYEEEKRLSRPIQIVAKQSSKQKSVKKSTSKAAGDFNDDDYESNLYRPKAQPTRRRQQSGLTLLSDVFENIVDSCIKFDKSKLFVEAVKKKDAPHYSEIIQTPMYLALMKNKAKRQEYKDRHQFLADTALILSNADRFNGQYSPITQLAREIVLHAEQKLNEVVSDVATYEAMVLINS